eukprot:CAMPEP_0178393838 /NCGR_PEP_ID=MMETSP0689_2-20121128/12391_1 /TAXON_ID=160604 /ORGANISM="Amphidinium massartii, Strain CS-259" /LENGTH=419 /DNA_ID=CAMNT_0020014437 /DNA_START=30 /DNA_END=1290 /DNA_ORIENTATION=-
MGTSTASGGSRATSVAVGCVVLLLVLVALAGLDKRRRKTYQWRNFNVVHEGLSQHFSKKFQHQNPQRDDKQPEAGSGAAEVEAATATEASSAVRQKPQALDLGSRCTSRPDPGAAESSWTELRPQAAAARGKATAEAMGGDAAQNRTASSSLERTKRTSCNLGRQTLGYFLDFSGQENVDKSLSRARFGSCAVLGNAGSIYGKGLGEEIDAHDLVIRVNHHIPNTSSAEEVRDKGCRTSMHVIFPFNAYYLSDSRPFLAAMLEFEPYYNTWFDCFTTGTPPCPCMAKVYENYTRIRRPRFISGPLYKLTCQKPLAVFNSYENIGRVRGNYLPSLHACGRAVGIGGKSPSSGFRATYFALAVCDKVSLYGLGSLKQFSPKHNHSWDYVKGHTASHHNIVGEHNWYAMLQKEGRIRQPDAE